MTDYLLLPKEVCAAGSGLKRHILMRYVLYVGVALVFRQMFGVSGLPIKDAAFYCAELCLDSDSSSSLECEDQSSPENRAYINSLS